jgi:hypothetical protein
MTTARLLVLYVLWFYYPESGVFKWNARAKNKCDSQPASFSISASRIGAHAVTHSAVMDNNVVYDTFQKYWQH